MRITIESDDSERTVTVSGAHEPRPGAGPALDAGPAPVGLAASGGLVQEPPAFTAAPAQNGPGSALSAGAAPAEEEVGP